MSPIEPNQPGGAELFETLSAYLDGELPPEETRRVEEMLARDPQAQRELQQLERTWDALDDLPRVEIPESFAHTTVEMIALSEQAEIDSARTAAPSRRRRALALAAGACALAAVAAFMGVRAMTPDPNEQLARDLPILEDLDAYLHVDSVEFLHVLADEGVFAEEADDAP